MWIWLYAPSADNPGDLMIRRIRSQDFPNCTLWWEGPIFLQSKYEFNNDKLDLTVELPDIKITKATQDRVVLTASVPHDLCQVSDRYTDKGKMTQELAYVHRFCHNVKNGIKVISNVLTLVSEYTYS